MAFSEHRRSAQWLLAALHVLSAAHGFFSFATGRWSTANWVYPCLVYILDIISHLVWDGMYVHWIRSDIFLHHIYTVVVTYVAGNGYHGWPSPGCFMQISQVGEALTLVQAALVDAPSVNRLRLIYVSLFFLVFTGYSVQVGWLLVSDPLPLVIRAIVYIAHSVVMYKYHYTWLRGTLRALDATMAVRHILCVAWIVSTPLFLVYGITLGLSDV
jgi:hypothetical protein